VAPESKRPNGFQATGDRTAPTTFVPESIRMVKPAYAVAKHFLEIILRLDLDALPAGFVASDPIRIDRASGCSGRIPAVRFLRSCEVPTMLFVVYWLLLAFGVALSVAGMVFLALGIFRRRQRTLFLWLGVGSIVAAWIPVVLFFGFLFANGARPAGWSPQNDSRPPTPATVAPSR
jgi:hypothetical protein